MILNQSLARQAGMLLTGSLVLAVGCTSVQSATQRVAGLARGSASSPTETDEDSTSEEPLDQPGSLRPSAEKPGDDAGASIALDAQVQNALSSAAWIATVPKADGSLPAHRWRHPLLEALPAEQHAADFKTALASDKPVVAANARLALARYSGEASDESLAEIVRQRSHPLPLRLAAAESLGKLAGDAARQQLRDLLDELASGEQFAKVHYVPELHAELLHALVAHCGHLAPREAGGSEDERRVLLDALAAPSPIVRLAAARGWLSLGAAPLPEQLLDRRSDPDPRVRGVVLESIGKWPPEHARDYLTAALNDQDLTVRLAAIRGLGLLTDDASLKDLRRLLEHDSEFVRAAAIGSLAARREATALLQGAEDPSWHVRLAVARRMGERRDPRTDALAPKLLADASPHVQQQMVASLADWPLEQAGPLFLEAMGQSGFLVRKAARDGLARRWPAAAGFVVDAPLDSRTQRLAALREQWTKQYDAVITVAAASGAPSPETTTKTAPDKLISLLDQLQAPQVDQRRRAADQLAQQATKGPLGEEAAGTLCRLVTAEPDTLVWRSALSALAGNTSEPATRLAYAGLSHPAAEVRRRACQHLEQHADPGHQEVLLKSLEDSDTEVIRAALAALARCGAGADPAPLERLLNASDKALRVEAAQCLVQMGAASGQAALDRLTLDADPAIRRQAAVALGRAGDPAALPALMRLLDDQGGVRQAALASLAQIAGKDVARPDPTEPPPNSLEEVHRWRAWYQARR